MSDTKTLDLETLTHVAAHVRRVRDESAARVRAGYGSRDEYDAYHRVCQQLNFWISEASE